jgi:hypothetical protein
LRAWDNEIRLYTDDLYRLKGAVENKKILMAQLLAELANLKKLEKNRKYS